MARPGDFTTPTSVTWSLFESSSSSVKEEEREGEIGKALSAVSFRMDELNPSSEETSFQTTFFVLQLYWRKQRTRPAFTKSYSKPLLSFVLLPGLLAIAYGGLFWKTTLKFEQTSDVNLLDLQSAKVERIITKNMKITIWIELLSILVLDPITETVLTDVEHWWA